MLESQCPRSATSTIACPHLYVTKPVEPAELIAVVANLARRR